MGIVFLREYLFVIVLGNRETIELEHFSFLWEDQLNVGFSSSTLIVASSPRLGPADITALILACAFRPLYLSLLNTAHHSAFLKFIFGESILKNYLFSCNKGWLIRIYLFFGGRPSQNISSSYFQKRKSEAFFLKCLFNKIKKITTRSSAGLKKGNSDNKTYLIHHD